MNVIDLAAFLSTPDWSASECIYCGDAGPTHVGVVAESLTGTLRAVAWCPAEECQADLALTTGLIRPI